MLQVTVSDIDERLRHLPPEKLAVVYDFVSYLLERGAGQILASESFPTMLASEGVLARDWQRPEEDEAWADL